MSPLTFNDYEGSYRLYLGPAFGRLPLGAILHEEIVKFMRERIASGLSESRVKGVLIPLSGMLTDVMSEGLIAKNPLRARHRGDGCRRRLPARPPLARAAPHLRLGPRRRRRAPPRA